MKDTDLDPAVPQAIAAVRIEQSRTFSGPLPPPETLRLYNEIVPDAAERILAMAESQQAHRQSLEREVIAHNLSAQRLGTVLGFVIAISVILGGLYLAATGKPSAGFASILAALVALVSVFVYGKREQQKELRGKETPKKTG